MESLDITIEPSSAGKYSILKATAEWLNNNYNNNNNVYNVYGLKKRLSPENGYIFCVDVCKIGIEDFVDFFLIQTPVAVRT